MEHTTTILQSHKQMTAWAKTLQCYLQVGKHSLLLSIDLTMATCMWSWRDIRWSGRYQTCSYYQYTFINDFLGIKYAEERSDCCGKWVYCPKWSLVFYRLSYTTVKTIAYETLPLIWSDMRQNTKDILMQLLWTLLFNASQIEH